MGILDHPSSSGSPSRPSGRMGIDWATWFPPLTSRTFLSHYLPASGALSHTLYTVHLFSPNIISKLFPTADLAVSNTILFNANVGLGFYVYFRRHLHRVEPWDRVEFSVITSTLFNFGSLLAAVLIKALFPNKSPTWAKTLTATALSVYLLSRAYKYLGFVDARSARGTPSPPRSPHSTMSRRSRKPASAASSRPASAMNGHGPPLNGHGPQQPHDSFPTPESSLRPHSTMNGHSPINEDSTMPMTPTATNYSATEMTSEFGDNTEYDGDEDCEQRMPKPNYRYLHSYALNNIGNQPRDKANILRRTTLGAASTPVSRRRTSYSKSTLPTIASQKEVSNTMCFVTPDQSLKSNNNTYSAMYTPPPSRLEHEQIQKELTIQQNNEEEEETPKKRHPRQEKRLARLEENLKMERKLDMIQYHAPLAIIPIVLVSFVCNNTLLPSPIMQTLGFIFS